MTDNTGEQLMQELLNKYLSQWSAEEIDGFIVDAYLSLEASMRGELRTSDGLPVQPSMADWGDVYDADGEQACVDTGGTPAYCVACLAGILFVSKVGTVIPEDDHPAPYDYGVTSMSVLVFMDGLRYLEEDGECGESIANLLNTMGYAVYPAKEGEYFSHMYEEKVAPILKRFIELNPRLTDRLRIATTKKEGV